MWPTSVAYIAAASTTCDSICDVQSAAAADRASHHAVILTADTVAVYTTLSAEVGGTLETGRYRRTEHEVLAEGAAVSCTIALASAVPSGFQCVVVTERGFLLFFSVARRASRALHQFDGAPWHEAATVEVPVAASVGVELVRKLNFGKDPVTCALAITSSSAEARFLVGTRSGCVRCVEWSGKVGPRLAWPRRDVEAVAGDASPSLAPKLLPIVALCGHIESDIVCVLGADANVSIASLSAVCRYDADASAFASTVRVQWCDYAAAAASAVALDTTGRVLAIGTSTGALHVCRIRIEMAARGNAVAIEAVRYLALEQLTDTSLDLGALVALQWSARSDALVVGWQNRGVAICSPTGSRLFVSLGASNDGGAAVNELCPFGTRAAAWSADGGSLLVAPRAPSDERGATLCAAVIGERASASGASPLYRLVCAQPTSESTSTWQSRAPAPAPITASLVAPALIDDVCIQQWRPVFRTRTHQSDWTRVCAPAAYTQLNWPVKCVARSPGGSHFAIAGRCGLAIVTETAHEGARWRMFGNITHEVRVRAISITWVDDDLIVLLNAAADGSHSLLCFPRRHLDHASLLAEFPLPVGVQPVAVCAARGHVFVTLADASQLVVAMRVDTHSGSTAPTLAAAAIPGDAEPHAFVTNLERAYSAAASAAATPLAPATITKWSVSVNVADSARSRATRAQQPAVSVQFKLIARTRLPDPDGACHVSPFRQSIYVRSATASFGVHWCLLLLDATGRLWALRADQLFGASGAHDRDDGGESRSSAGMRLIAQDIERVWAFSSHTLWLGDAMSPPSTALADVAAPAASAHPDIVVRAACVDASQHCPCFITHGASGTQLWFSCDAAPCSFSAAVVLPFDADTVPIGVDESHASVVFVHRPQLAPLNASSAENRAASVTVPMHGIMRTSTVSLLPVALCHWVSNRQPHVALRCVHYWKCDTALSAHLESLLVSVVDDDLEPARRGADRLPLVVEFLRHLSSFAHVLVACIRKSDSQRWHRLLDLCGSPLHIMETCLNDALLHTAAALLLVVERCEGAAVTRLLSVRILRDALAAESYELANEVNRFFESSMPAAAGVNGGHNNERSGDAEIEQLARTAWCTVMDAAADVWALKYADRDLGEYESRRAALCAFLSGEIEQ